MTTRAEFLARIRSEIGRGGGSAPIVAAPRAPRPADALELLERELRERWPATLDRFIEEFQRVGGIFHRAATAADVPQVIGDIARARGLSRVITWHPRALGVDLTGALTAERLAVDVVPDGGVADDDRAGVRSRSAQSDLGLTGVDLAIAETGTMVLRSGAGRPRSTSLLPPYHVAVFDRSVLVESLQQLGVVLEAWHAEPDQTGGGAMINLITGPSRTADIELTLTVGVHGPKEVHAIFVEQPFRG